MYSSFEHTAMTNTEGGIHAFLLSMSNVAGLGVIIVEASGKILFINDIYAQWLNVNKADPPENLKILQNNLFNHCFSNAKSTPFEENNFDFFEYNLERKGLKVKIACEILKIPLHENENQQVLLLTWFKNQTDLSIQESFPQDMIHSLISRAPIGILSIDHNWDCQFANEEVSQLTNYSHDELMGRGWTTLFDNKNDQLQEMINTLLCTGFAQIELELNQPCFGRRILQLDIRGNIENSNTLEHAVCAMIDVTDRVERQQEIHRLANYDSVTGLSNRLALKHQLERYLDIAKRLRNKIQLLFIDLDGFKTINDLYGHAFGDQVLIQVAGRLKSQVRQSDVISRFGGDEFIIVMPGDVPDDVVDGISDKINAALGQPYLINDIPVHLTASIGVASFIGETKSETMDTEVLVDELLKQADLAMYQAKNQGKNQFVRYNVDQGQEVTLAYSIGQLLPDAISEQKIHFYYQPIVNARTQETLGVEALLRWHDSKLGWINPETAIHVAETNGLIIPLQHYMLDQVISDFSYIVKCLDSHGNDIRLSVNICAIQLMNFKYTSVIFEKFDKSDIDIRRITLELTEGTLIENRSEVFGNLEFLIEKGFKIALDDFGTGFSSLSYLSHFPIDIVKLDKSFLLQIKNNKQQCALVSGCVHLIHSLDKLVVAEGIETEEDCNLLKAFSCDLIQGYFFSQALQRDELCDWIKGKVVIDN